VEGKILTENCMWEGNVKVRMEYEFADRITFNGSHSLAVTIDI
jgi:hypothetical protein